MSHATSVITGNVLTFHLPEIGEGVVEGEVVRWLVKPGDRVEENQVIIEVMTDKATVEIPSPKGGKVLETTGKEGEMIQVAAPLIKIELEGVALAPVSEAPAAAPTAQANAPAISAAPVNGSVSNGKVLAAPATRRRARELGIDLSIVSGSGPAGRVTNEDLAKFQDGTPATQAPLSAPVPAPISIPVGAREERVALRGLRKRIAERMPLAKQKAAHVTHVDEVDMTELVALRNRLKPLAEKQGVKLSFLPFIVKAVVATLKKFPNFNSSIDEATNELVYKHYYNIGIAVDTENGLIVPVIKDADRKGLLEIATEIYQLADKARTGKASADELSGGTFTLTSIGSVGGLMATPIVNVPEVAILAVMKIQQRPVVRNGEIVIRDMMYLPISFDHRVVDGADAARFINQLAEYLQTPELLML